LLLKQSFRLQIHPPPRCRSARRPQFSHFSEQSTLVTRSANALHVRVPFGPRSHLIATDEVVASLKSQKWVESICLLADAFKRAQPGISRSITSRFMAASPFGTRWTSPPRHHTKDLVRGKLCVLTGKKINDHQTSSHSPLHPTRCDGIYKRQRRQRVLLPVVQENGWVPTQTSSIRDRSEMGIGTVGPKESQGLTRKTRHAAPKARVKKRKNQRHADYGRKPAATRRTNKN